MLSDYLYIVRRDHHIQSNQIGNYTDSMRARKGISTAIPIGIWLQIIHRNRTLYGHGGKWKERQISSLRHKREMLSSICQQLVLSAKLLVTVSSGIMWRTTRKGRKDISAYHWYPPKHQTRGCRYWIRFPFLWYVQHFIHPRIVLYIWQTVFNIFLFFLCLRPQSPGRSPHNCWRNSHQ